MVPLREAMDTLRGMFPQLDPEVVRTVLESHNGHMEQAVESLLAINGDSRGEGSGVQGPTTGTERSFGLAGTSGTQTQEQIHRDELIAARLQHQLNTESEDEWSFWCGAPGNRPPPVRVDAEARNETEAYPTQDLGQTLNSGWLWMQDSTSWLTSYITESLGEMIEEPGTNPTADLQDVASPTSRARSDDRNRERFHPSRLSSRTTEGTPIPEAKRSLPVANISGETIRDRRMHAPEEITAHEDEPSPSSSSRNNSKSRQPEVEEDTLDTMATDVLEFLGVVEPEPSQPTRDSKKDK
mmetsp:Transcript_32535/g.71115  ORF Transcript_32535/g.71115 Transcript_32535/m.71115 type:complete len:297 (+) Transcript_32535:346-1236(+)|eukprot:CAMPEP_0118925744 /NCGR_PEP_ID=MMETSP1169-20130426/3576_1 /TAXON_ID=36882 /ORGANISM="Pyramimonas obovata, Strain CCMP722" /LENGTH=296 /DNA_ID=CAMNT_0006867125 /DNA_START=346 /DNA_END=1236 /DNA_ORIENTATION=-